MASDMEVHMKQMCVNKSILVENMAYDLHQCLLNVYGDQTVDVSTVMQWVLHFSSGDSSRGSHPVVMTFYKHGMQALTHRCQKYIANGGDSVEKIGFVAENLFYQIVLLCCLYQLYIPQK